MSKFSEYVKKAKKNDKEFFYGEIKKTSNKYFKFNRYHSDDEVVIITNNITTVKDDIVLVVDNNKAVYLKDWQVRAVKNYTEGIYAFAVKLNRNFFKKYTFKSEFEGLTFDHEETFDDMVELAKEQDEENMSIAEGWFKNERIEWNHRYR